MQRWPCTNPPKWDSVRLQRGSCSGPPGILPHPFPRPVGLSTSLACPTCLGNPAKLSRSAAQGVLTPERCVRPCSEFRGDTWQVVGQHCSGEELCALIAPSSGDLPAFLGCARFTDRYGRAAAESLSRGGVGWGGFRGGRVTADSRRSSAGLLEGGAPQPLLFLPSGVRAGQHVTRGEGGSQPWLCFRSCMQLANPTPERDGERAWKCPGERGQSHPLSVRSCPRPCICVSRLGPAFAKVMYCAHKRAC